MNVYGEMKSKLNHPSKNDSDRRRMVVVITREASLQTDNLIYKLLMDDRRTEMS